MEMEIFSHLYQEAVAGLEAGDFAKARSLWIHCADLPLSFLQLTKLNHLAKKFETSSFNIKKKLRFALVASSTTHHLREALQAHFRIRGFDAEIYESPFDSIEQEILNPQSGLYRFEPTHALIWMGAQDLGLKARDRVNPHWENLRGLWDHLQRNLPSCQVIQTTFVIPPERALGGLETRLDWSQNSLLRALNDKIRRESGSALHILDLDWLSASFGKRAWHDSRFWFHSKHSFSLNATAWVSGEIVRLISAMSGLSRKCLVLDLDNTLWGGVIGDDGLEGIQVGESASGEAFVAFQDYVKSLKERGVILAVCSKNNEETAKEPFRKHPGMVLKEEDISIFVANWENKADNIRQIAQTLEIGLDSIVFCDDNPVERKMVRDFLPEVYTVEMPQDPSFYVEALDCLGLFELIQVSEEDFHRTEQYRANQARSELKGQVASLDDFLKDLQMVGSILPVGENNWDRPLQLINKSNQFNLLTNRYTPVEFQSLFKSSDWIGHSFRLMDRFGDNGLIAVITARIQNEELWIQDWVMSCRVLSRGMESFAFNALVELAQGKGCHSMIGRYRPTKKNGLVSGLLPGLGFHLIEKNEQEEFYRLNVRATRPKSHFIQIAAGSE